MAPPSLGARIIVFGFFGSFAVVGALFLFIAGQSLLGRLTFMNSATHTRGTILEMRAVHTTRTGAGTMVPVFRYTASDGQSYLIVSAVSVRASAFTVGQEVPVLYRAGQPNTAVIESYGPLFMYPTVFGIVGAAFFTLPAILFLRYFRMRRQQAQVQGD
jgi:hypothetical protein